MKSTLAVDKKYDICFTDAEDRSVVYIAEQGFFANDAEAQDKVEFWQSYTWVDDRRFFFRRTPKGG